MTKRYLFITVLDDRDELNQIRSVDIEVGEGRKSGVITLTYQIFEAMKPIVNEESSGYITVIDLDTQTTLVIRLANERSYIKLYYQKDIDETLREATISVYNLMESAESLEDIFVSRAGDEDRAEDPAYT